LQADVKDQESINLRGIKNNKSMTEIIFNEKLLNEMQSCVNDILEVHSSEDEIGSYDFLTKYGKHHLDVFTIADTDSLEIECTKYYLSNVATDGSVEEMRDDLPCQNAHMATNAILRRLAILHTSKCIVSAINNTEGCDGGFSDSNYKNIILNVDGVPFKMAVNEFANGYNSHGEKIEYLVQNWGKDIDCYGDWFSFSYCVSVDSIDSVEEYVRVLIGKIRNVISQ